MSGKKPILTLLGLVDSGITGITILFRMSPIPPVMGLFVKLHGNGGYASGFSVFLVQAVVALILFAVLNRYAPTEPEATLATS